MEEAPTPDFLEKSKNEIKGKKEYLLNHLNEQYNLIIERDLSYIYFKLYKLNEITLFNYENKFNLKDIIHQLKINPDYYNNIEKICILIEELYSNKKIYLKNNNNCIDLVLNLNENFKEYEIFIPLKKTELKFNEKFDLIFNEIKAIKNNTTNLFDDRIYGIEILLDDIKNDVNIKINEEKKEIDSFEKNVIKNVKEINESYDEIKKLKDRINNIKKQKEKLKIDLKNT